MPKGYCHTYFYDNPNVEKEKDIEEIYRLIQEYSSEFFIDDPLYLRQCTDFFVPLPPLKYKGVFLKGMFLSQGVDYIHSLFPKINELFFSMAFSMWGSIPYSEKAECYLTCYNNLHREIWFKSVYPNKKDKIFIPLQDVDFTNDIMVCPEPIDKDIDIICISSLYPRKNIPLLLETLITYHKKYGKLLKAVLITGTRTKDYDEAQIQVLKELEAIAGGSDELNKYIEIKGYVKYGDALNSYYSRAKLAVLTSIFEGKNRSISEAILCNTPVVIFKDFNKYIRGGDKAFPDNAGLYAPEFSAKSLAETIHKALNNLEQFTPRDSYLKENGRLNFLNKCVDSIPYYHENLPNYSPGHIEDNEWFIEALADNYDMSLIQFLYGWDNSIQQTKLHENNTAVMDFYNKKFNITY